MVNKKLQNLKTQQQSIKSQLNSFESYVETIKIEFDANSRTLQDQQGAELEIRFDKISKTYNQFEIVQNEIESNTPIGGLADELSVRDAIENKFCHNLAIAKIMLVSQKKRIDVVSIANASLTDPQNVVESNNLRSVKLPVIDLPKFDGNYNKWLEYRDTFNSVVHHNNTLDDILKFQYLKSSLIGDAAKVINFLETSRNNYSIAWDLLTARYNKKRFLVNNHLKALFDIKVVNAESARDIRNIVNETSQHLRALVLLEQPVESWDAIIVHLITSKLDSLTLREWERNMKENEIPTQKQLLDFLTEKADTLETCNVNTNSKPQFKYNRDGNNPYKPSTKVYLATNQNQKCSFCNGDHSISNCSEFTKIPMNQRLERAKEKALCINCLRTGHFIRECKASLCRTCGQKHHTLLHIDKTSNRNSVESKRSNETPATATNCYLSQYAQTTPQTLLATIIVNIVDTNGKLQQGRALLDSGSQSNIMTEQFCATLGLETTPVQISVSGIGAVMSKLNSKCLTTIVSRTSQFRKTLSFLIAPTICEKIPSSNISKTPLAIPSNLQLADPTFNVPGQIDMLLGASIFWRILGTNRIKIGNDMPILQDTKFGYIITGPLPRFSRSIYCNTVTINNCSNKAIQDQLRKFWEIEECDSNPVRSVEERECENHFSKTVSRDQTGRFIVSIPLKDSIAKLGESKQRALEQFYALENKLIKNPSLRKMYINFMREYIDLNHMTKSVNNQNEVRYFMPHHGVLKEENITTKLRVVFNASARTTSGVSFNDIQMNGPTIQSDLFSILVRFREYAYVVCADISKMYRQILITPEQRSLQMILWRCSQNEPITEYMLNTVTYGTTSAPYLATRCIDQVAKENAKSNKRAAAIIQNDMYVDDLITGDDDREVLAQNSNAVAEILQSAGFTLRKWKSNDKQILNLVSLESSEQFMTIGQNEKTKTLGVLWECKSDELTYQININSQSEVVSKRIILSRVSQIFDPLGLLSACTIKAKIILQRLWLEKLSWDDPVSDTIRARWEKFENELRELNSLKVPRYVSNQKAEIREIHAFCDASREAYGACVYIRSINTTTGSIVSNLLCTKTKVAPLKPLSTPRLELCAAVVAARLVDKVLKSLNHQHDSCEYWSDSTIVLAWIKSNPNSLKCFVSNRIVEIQDLSKHGIWRHVKTKDNPADMLSRGISPLQIQHAKDWWHGPPWLGKPRNEWPNEIVDFNVEIPEKRDKDSILVCIEQSSCLLDRFSDFSRMKRVLSYCYRFAKNCKSNQTTEPRQFGPLTLVELNNTVIRVLKIVQLKTFSVEHRCLIRKIEIPKNSKLSSLHPFLDESGVMRVGGRLSASQYSYEKKHPIILPKVHLTKLLIKAEHVRLLHTGPQQLLYSIRERFWPISGRNIAKEVVRQCITCFKVKPRITTPMMGNLPRNRVAPAHPFMYCGVDYGGPFFLRDRKGRGYKKYKAYMALFVCFVSKAIHIELVTDLTKDAFLASFRRFTARRGLPIEMNSDNGTNFIGAKNELNELGKFLKENRLGLEQHFSSNGISWKFIPPQSPHMGGLWEAGIRSAKHHIKRVAANALLTYEEFCTLLNQIEAVLNSRPLSILSSEPDDPIPLTPSHFIVGRPLTSPPDPDVRHIPENRLSCYQRLQLLNQHFWSRWSKEYVSELQQRQKWKSNCESLKIDTLVMIKEENSPPLCWPMGIVTQLHPGSDGVTRVATVRTTQGIFKRPVVKLCPLPSENE